MFLKDPSSSIDARDIVYRMRTVSVLLVILLFLLIVIMVQMTSDKMMNSCCTFTRSLINASSYNFSSFSLIQY